ncbi:MAG: PASTA domain-containing protein [Deltaproteobacteria bacterium]|nr:PASTA domain-containing protein [Deltaproteobacteria bacterium]
MSPDVVARVKELGLEGVGFEPETWRVYAGKERAAHVVGFVGRDGHGLEGIELAEDDGLSGEGYRLDAERDGRGRALHTSGLDDRPLSPSGKDVVLTLDLGIQEAAEEELGAAVTRFGARAGTAVVLDPRTGDVLALAVAPTFNPNDLSRGNADLWRDRAVTDVFEPGSTLKPFTAAAALELGAVSEGEEIDCHGGAWKLGDHVIHDHSRHDLISFAEVIRVSSNIGTAQIGLRLGAEALGASLAGFGFGQRTQLGLPGEVRGVLHPPARWKPIQTANVAFGQGLSVTAVQLASAYATLANDGVRMAPRLVLGLREASDGAGRRAALEPRPPVEVARPISARTAARVTALLEGVVTAEGTGEAARLPGVRVAGKTGTAQKARVDGRGYDDERVVASFAGYVPADDPRLVIVVAVDEPTGPVTFGGLVAAPVFREIARRALPIVGVPVGASAPAFPETAVASASPADTRVASAAPRSSTHPLRPVRDASRGIAPDGVSGTLGVAPDLTGLSIRAALRESARLGLPVTVAGRGTCVAQEPPAGAPLPVGATIRAWFAPAGAVAAERDPAAGEASAT